MDDVGRIRRAGRHELAGRRRSNLIAVRLGTALREARTAAGLEQSQVATRAGVSQPLVSHLERGFGSGTTLETWSRVAAAAGEQLVAFLEHTPGTDQPRDLEHLKRQSALVSIAARGGWHAMPELAIDPSRARSRSIDVALIRRPTREAIAAEIWDWFADVGAGFRNIDGKRTTLAERLGTRGPTGDDAWNVRALYIVRDTRRNHELVAQVLPLFAARFPGRPSSWLKALTDPAQALPEGDGLLWSDRAGTALKVSRLRT
jgi:transcriptional regulator with XRE-family HTH domain